MRKKLPEFKQKLDDIVKNYGDEYVSSSEIVLKLVTQEKQLLQEEEPVKNEPPKAHRKASSGSTRDEEISEDDELKYHYAETTCKFYLPKHPDSSLVTPQSCFSTFFGRFQQIWRQDLVPEVIIALN